MLDLCNQRGAAGFHLLKAVDGQLHLLKVALRRAWRSPILPPGWPPVSSEMTILPGRQRQRGGGLVDRVEELVGGEGRAASLGLEEGPHS
jgi:hypothetical protein